MKIYNDVTELIGKTPLLRLNKITEGSGSTVLIKLERNNPGGSIKDRICLNMIKRAEEEGKLKPGGTIVEPTSGNTGIGLALIGAARGYKVILTMPESMSIERRKLLKAYGAEIILTPGAEGMRGAIKKAEELLEKGENIFMPQQFKNPANPEIHSKTTAMEIWEDTDGKIDYFVAGVGTGGTLTGVGRVLKELAPEIKVIAVEPASSAVISGEKPGLHRIQGIGAGFIPEVLDTELINEVIKIDDETALETSRRAAREEGILLGISSGAAIAAALKIAEGAGKGKTILAIAPDTGERYLSTELFEV
ncbi:MAG: cysteine synthase A [Halanaerobiaceae bacterium]|nr:cysteine synthase A [Halanaerobiaceae bacterium]